MIKPYRFYKLLQKFQGPEAHKDRFHGKTNASVAIIILIDSLRQKESVLFIKRTKNENDPWSGHYGLPGGMSEAKESFYDTCIRETMEEVGLDLTEHRFLGPLSPLQVQSMGDKLDFYIHPFVFVIRKDAELKICPSEVESYHWINSDDILNSNNIKFKKKKMRSGELEVPCLIVEEHEVWGITYIILGKLLLAWSGLQLPFSGRKITNRHWLKYFPYGDEG